MNLSSKVKFFLELQAQLKINHWQTKINSRHRAFGEAYDQLSEKSDEFIEIAIFKFGGKFILNNEDKTLSLFNLSELSINDLINKSIDSLIDISNELGERDTDLLNIRDEMIGVLNKMGYLLTQE